MDPSVLDYLRRKQGLAPGPDEVPPPQDGMPPPPPPPMAAGPDPAAAPPVAPPPAPPQRIGLGMDPTVLKHLVGMLGPDFDPAAFRNAQEEDYAKTTRNRLNEAGQQIAAAMGNVPYQPQDPTSNVQQSMLMARRQNLLGTTEAAGKLQGMLMQQSLLDPASPMSRFKQDAAARDPKFLAYIGQGDPSAGERAIRSTPGFLIDQMVNQWKESVGVGKTAAETENLGATATKTRAEIPGVGADALLKMRSASPVTPQFVAEVQRNLQVRLTPDMTYGEADKRIEEALKARGQDTELLKWRAEHNAAIAPGVLYTGPGIPQPEEARDYREKLAATNKLNGLLEDYRGLVAGTSRVGKLVGPDAARLRAIHGELMAEVRTLIGAKTLTDSDIKLADAIVPPAAGAEGIPTWTRSTLAALDTIKTHARQGIQKIGDSRFYHVFDPGAAFGETAKPSPAAPPAPGGRPPPPSSWRPD